MKLAHLFLSLLVLLAAVDLNAAEGDLLSGSTDAISRGFLGPVRSDFISPSLLGLQFDEATIQNGSGNALRVWDIKAPESEQTILFCMGNQGNISTHLAYAKLLVDGGFNVCMFDYQGFGGSQGTASALSLFDDASCVTEYLLTEKRLEPANVGCFGVSLGSALAVAVAAKYNLAAVAVEDILLPVKMLDQIASNLPADIASKIALGTIRNVLLPQVDPLTTAKNLSCPIMLIHGENDKLLPISGTIELVSVLKVPTRVWLMEDAGHAPETLDIYDGEYGHQLQSFFRDAFIDRLAIPRIDLSLTQQEDQWLARVKLQCSEAGFYQVALANAEGTCHFVKCRLSDELEFNETVPFEPTHVSAINFKNADTDGERWIRTKTDRTRSLETYRSLEANFLSNCPIQSRLALFFGMLRTVNYRQKEDLDWLKSNLPPVDSIHPDIRPRFALLVCRAFGQMTAPEQEANADFVALALPYLPAEPNIYFQLENGGYQVQLRDEILAGSLILLAKRQYELGSIDQSRELLRRAVSVTKQNWPTLELIDKLQPNARFYESLGAPVDRN